MPLLSRKRIPVRERLMFALDVDTQRDAMKIVEDLGDSVQFYKVGLQLFMSDNYFTLIDWLGEKGKKVFADLKFHDVPETVRAAVRQLSRRKVEFATVHAGSDAIMRAAVEEKKTMKILAVTALTSLDQNDVDDLGFKCSVEELVLSRARRALEIGCDGVISSGIEAPKLKEKFGDRLIIVSPGIRPVENRQVDDQKRTVDIETAFNNGADYIVVGRPIRTAPDPRARAEEIQTRIAAVFSESA